MCRHQGILASTSDRSNLLQAGFTQKTFRQITQQYPYDPFTPSIQAYMHASIKSVVPTVSNATMDITYPLDRLSSGNGLLHAYQSTLNSNYSTALSALRTSVALQPRNAEGSLWYYTYPNYTYLDGMYSLAPFLTLYSISFSNDSRGDEAMIDNVIHQLDLAWKHTYQPSSGLLVHGYDASNRAIWTNSNDASGASPHVWARSLGWYLMSLLDTLQLVPESSGLAREWLVEHFQTLMRSVVDAVDDRTGAWWQVMDQPGREGNYIESSASAMFVYALLKGARLGCLEQGGGNDGYTAVARRAYEFIVDEFVVENGNGTLGWNGTVSVCSLNSSATYEYYVGQPILNNSVLGAAAFVQASLEYERLNITAT